MAANIIQTFETATDTPAILTDADTLLYFSIPGQTTSLWRTDGTTEGTTPLLNQGESATVDLRLLEFSTGSNGRLFFNAATENDYEPWLSSGTPENTSELADLNPNTGSNPEDFYALGDVVIFTASDEFANEDKLWVSDGTQAGTQTLELVASDGAAQNPVNFADRDRGGNLYFSTQGGGGGYLWRTDGTQEGTQQVFDFGANVSTAGRSPQSGF